MYQMFLGWGELIPAVLLLFRRTTLIGALIMFVVMLNVFLINIFFDVCVKLNSGLYTVLALYILLQETPRAFGGNFGPMAQQQMGRYQIAGKDAVVLHRLALDA